MPEIYKLDYIIYKLTLHYLGKCKEVIFQQHSTVISTK